MHQEVSASTSRNTAFANSLALIAGCFSAGILVERWSSIPAKVSLSCGVAFAALALVFYFKHKLALSTLMICFSFVSMGIADATFAKRNHRTDTVRQLYVENVISSDDPVEVTGLIDAAPEFAPNGFYLKLRVEKLRFRGNVYNVSGEVELFAFFRDKAERYAYDALGLHYGRRMTVMTALSRSETFRNPGGSLRSDYLDERGLDTIGAVKSPLLVEPLGDEPVFLPLALLYEWRQRLLTEFNQRFSPDTAGVLDAALLGNRYYLSQAEAERFRDGGTFHVLVINGLHIGFIAWMLWLLARRLTASRLVQFLISAGVLWAYVFAIGASTSVVRAALMFVFAGLAPVLFRRVTAVNALGCAALVILIARPIALFDPAFQLTIFSVLAIVTIAFPIFHKLKEVGSWRPTSQTTYPPRCAKRLRAFAEALFWSEKQWQSEMAMAAHSYRLFKTSLAPTLERLHIQRPCRYAFQAVVVSISLQIGLLPLLILYFHRVSLASLLLNVYVGLLMASLAFVSLLAISVAQLSAAAASPLLSIADKVNWLIVHSVDPFAIMHVSSMRLPQYTGLSFSVYIVYYLLLLGLILLLARWKPLSPARARAEKQKAGTLIPLGAAGAFAIVLAVVLMHPFSASRGDGRLRIDHLDVGQGDSALLTMPDGATLLIDGGGRPHFGPRKEPDVDEATPEFQRDAKSIGEAVVAEYLWWRGLDHVDYILATHADADHIDGLNFIESNFRVGSAIVARTPRKDPEYARFAETARNNGVPITLVGRGDVLRFGGVTAEVLWPPTLANPDAPYRNNDSLVLRVRYGERSFVLAGDVEKQSEAAILSPATDLAADVVKVAHHGSKTSSTEAFISATHPKLAVISVGRVSPFGHPAPDVVQRWIDSGAEVLTTGKKGTITISTDGKDLRVDTFVHD